MELTHLSRIVKYGVGGTIEDVTSLKAMAVSRNVTANMSRFGQSVLRWHHNLGFCTKNQ